MKVLKRLGKCTNASRIPDWQNHIHSKEFCEFLSLVRALNRENWIKATAPKRMGIANS